jgi:septation ring formation regulator EzrA
LADGESTPDGADEALFTLVERDGNPDPDIAQAKKHLAEALTAVMAAELDRSEREKNAASQAAGRAYQLVEAVLAAKAFVERQVPEVRANLGRLTSEVPGADTAVAELESDFLPANFSGQPAKRDRAKKAIATAPDYFAQIKKAYDEQRFLAARSTVEGLASLVQGSRNELTEIHARLAELKKLRQQSRDVVAETRRKANALASKLRAHSFTTSQATDDEFQRFEATLRQHEAEVGKKVTDWPAAAQAASRLAGALTSIDSAIDRQKSEHESATGKVSALGSAVSDAQGYVNDGDTRQPARNKLAEAKSALADVQAQMQRAKSDWTAIGRRADEAVPLASRARELAQQDKSAANAARSAISRAESNISSVNRSYGHGVFADTSSAQSYLASARSSLSRGDYEDASRQADSAYRAAESAESDAMARVAAIIAAIEAERRRREEEERQRREAEEAARRASESSYSSSSSWSSSGSSDSYSGGGSYDSGSSGGGSYSSGSGGSDY